jgi:hypothetical protein
VAGGVDRDLLELREHLAGERVDQRQRLDLVVEELDAHDARLLVDREDLDHVAAHAEGAVAEVERGALVLGAGQRAQHVVALDALALPQLDAQALVELRAAQAVDARDAGHDEHVAPLEQRAGRAVAQPLDLLVDEGLLLDVGVRARDVGLGLVVVVVRDEVLDGVLGEQVPELVVQLRRQRLVVCQHERRPPELSHDVRHREGLARPRHAPQHLPPSSLVQTLDELGDGLGLVAPWHEVGVQSEGLIAHRGRNIGWPRFGAEVGGAPPDAAPRPSGAPCAPASGLGWLAESGWPCTPRPIKAPDWRRRSGCAPPDLSASRGSCFKR